MKYRCQDIFMVRVPSLPYFHTQNYLNWNDTTREYIHQNHLENFFDEGLLSSTRALHTAFHSEKQSEKQEKKTNESLGKYLVRGSSRPTPYGTWSRVGLGQWGTEDQVVIFSDKKIKKAQIDDQWLCFVIYSLEKDLNILKQLKLKINPIVYVNGDRVKNPYFSNHGLVREEGFEETFSKNDMKNTGLIELLRVLAEDFISYRDLNEHIKHKYEGIPEELIERTLLQLVDKEILLTNLRFPAFCENPLLHTLEVLHNLEQKPDVYFELERLNALLNQYESDEHKNDILQEFYEKVAAIHERKDYLKVDTGLVFSSATLSSQIKDKLEHFMDKFSQLAATTFENSQLVAFKEAFSEKYGPFVDVPIAEIIDENAFHGLSKMGREEKEASPREAKIRSIFDYKILQALAEGKEEIQVTLEDFESCELDKENTEKNTAFDLNVFVTKTQDNYQFVIGPNIGGMTGGSMFQRFSPLFDKALYEQYNTIYDEIREQTQEAYLTCEIREAIGTGRLANIVSQVERYPYYITIGNTEEITEGEIPLHDLAIGINDNDQLYIKSLSKQRLVKVITNHMLNPNMHSKVAQLLLAISTEYETVLLDRISMVYKNNYATVPRIVFEGVVISPRTWNLNSSQFHMDTFKSFIKDFEEFQKDYDLEKYVYLSESDNRLIIDIRQRKYQEQVYELLKKNQIVALLQLEAKTSESLLVQNENGEKYIGEFVFSFVKERKSTLQLLNRPSFLLQNREDKYSLGDNGWVYLKLYEVNERQDELLTKYVSSAVETLIPEKFFFLRYYDEQQHLRIRLKFPNEQIAMQKLLFLNQSLKEWRNKGLFSNVMFDTYEPEINRYGGKELLENTHDIFDIDSKFVLALLENFNLEDTKEKEMVYFVGMLSAFLALSGSSKELFELLDSEDLRKQSASEFKKERNKWMKWVEEVENATPQRIDERFQKLQELYFKRIEIYKAFANKMNREEEQLTSTKQDIICSLVHMFCNRTTGERQYENRSLGMLRYALFNYLEKQKHMNSKKKKQETKV